MKLTKAQLRVISLMQKGYELYISYGFDTFVTLHKPVLSKDEKLESANVSFPTYSFLKENELIREFKQLDTGKKYPSVYVITEKGNAIDVSQELSIKEQAATEPRKKLTIVQLHIMTNVAEPSGIQISKLNEIDVTKGSKVFSGSGFRLPVEELMRPVKAHRLRIQTNTEISLGYDIWFIKGKEKEAVSICVENIISDFAIFNFEFQKVVGSVNKAKLLLTELK